MKLMSIFHKCETWWSRYHISYLKTTLALSKQTHQILLIKTSAFQQEASYHRWAQEYLETMKGNIEGRNRVKGQVRLEVVMEYNQAELAGLDGSTITTDHIIDAVRNGLLLRIAPFASLLSSRQTAYTINGQEVKDWVTSHKGYNLKQARFPQPVGNTSSWPSCQMTYATDCRQVRNRKQQSNSSELLLK